MVYCMLVHVQRPYVHCHVTSSRTSMPEQAKHCEIRLEIRKRKNREEEEEEEEERVELAAQNPNPRTPWRRRRWRAVVEKVFRRRRRSWTRGTSNSSRRTTSRLLRSTRRPSSLTPTTPPSTGFAPLPPPLPRSYLSCGCSSYTLGPAFGSNIGVLSHGLVWCGGCCSIRVGRRTDCAQRRD